MGLTSLDDVADALYAGDPARFVAARDEAAKAARASGDRELAAAIKALRKPSVSAWYVNAGVRASLVSLREWLALGSDLREAQAALDAARVRELGASRTRLEDRVVRDLTAHLTALGVAAGPAAMAEVRDTLRAALADAAASDAVASGRLDRALSYGGFGEVDLSAALAAMAGARRDARPAEPERAASQPAEPEPPATATAPDPALVAALEQARAKLALTEERRAAASDQALRAEAAVAAAQRTLRDAERSRREAKASLESAERAESAASRAVAEASAALDDPGTADRPDR